MAAQLNPDPAVRHRALLAGRTPEEAIAEHRAGLERSHRALVRLAERERTVDGAWCDEHHDTVTRAEQAVHESHRRALAALDAL